MLTDAVCGTVELRFRSPDFERERNESPTGIHLDVHSYCNHPVRLETTRSPSGTLLDVALTLYNITRQQCRDRSRTPEFAAQQLLLDL